MYKVENHEYQGAEQRSYGFSVSRTNGYSLPKGFTSSYCATVYNMETQGQKVWIEFAIQSPTGDSSDHHNYTFPCVDFEQAMHIVDTKREEIRAAIKLLNKQELYV